MRKSPPNFKDLTGQKFNRLTVVERRGSNKEQRPLWLCRCDCGSEKLISGKSLRNGHAQSCGCYNRDLTAIRNARHGYAARGSKLPEHNVWCRMRQRCANPKCSDFPLYGGRGIKVCERWDSFDAFISDMGMRPSRKHSIDRIDVNGNYEPGNCQWSTVEAQANNKRNTRHLTLNGETKRLRDWAMALGIKRSTLQDRLSMGWSDERTLTTPPGRFYKKPQESNA